MLFGGGLSGPEFVLIIEIHAIGNLVEAASSTQIFHHSEKLIFAVKAALPVVAGIFGPLELRRGNDFDRKSLLLGERQRVSELSAREAGRIGDHGQHISAERTVSRPREI